MTPITDAATRLKEICTRHGKHPAARGATDADVDRIKETFTELEFPVPEGLLEVYRVTLAIPGVLNSEPVLWAPCLLSGPPAGQVMFLINQEDDADEEGVLWLGRGNKGDLIVDRHGQCGLEPVFQPDKTVRLIDPSDFQTAFLAYVERQEAEIAEQFARTGRRPCRPGRS